MLTEYHRERAYTNNVTIPYGSGNEKTHLVKGPYDVGGLACPFFLILAGKGDE